MSRKLTPADAATIKASTEPAKVLAARYGISCTNVYNIRAGRVHNIPNPPAGDWRDVPDYAGAYRVSSDGQVWSMLQGRVLAESLTSWGYAEVNLSRLGHGSKRRSVHRIVATAFIPNPLNKPEVNHIDGNKRNNCVANLEWVTKRENAAHAVSTGAYRRRTRGSRKTASSVPAFTGGTSA